MCSLVTSLVGGVAGLEPLMWCSWCLMAGRDGDSWSEALEGGCGCSCGGSGCVFVVMWRYLLNVEQASEW